MSLHENIPVNKENDLNSQESVPHNEQTARTIAAELRFEDALVTLTDQDLLSEQIERVQIKYESILNIDDLKMSNDDWAMLTVLELYDIQTADHSVRVLENAYEAINKPLSLGDNQEPFFLSSYIAEEGVTVDEFLHAALFHDIGKTVIPHIILRDKTTHTEFDELFCNHLQDCNHDWLNNIGITNLDNPTEALNELHNKNKRPIDILPLHTIISPEDFVNLQQNFPYINITPETTMREILELHEAESERILRVAGLEVSGIIAGQHHNYANKPLTYPRATSALRISRTSARNLLANIIQIVDVSDAIRSSRSYKTAENEFTVLEELVSEAEAGRLDATMAQAWIKTEYQNIISTAVPDITSEQVIEQKAHIESFISTLMEVNQTKVI